MTAYLLTYRMADGSERSFEILAIDAFRAGHQAPRLPGARLLSILPKEW